MARANGEGSEPRKNKKGLYQVNYVAGVVRRHFHGCAPQTWNGIRQHEKNVVYRAKMVKNFTRGTIPQMNEERSNMKVLRTAKNNLLYGPVRTTDARMKNIAHRSGDERQRI